jgi:NAD(P)-dependent dehydrogenase (short-subunit alcohol dehydrogenase family)
VSYRRLGNRLQRVQALDRLPDLTGKVAFVTGGTDGVGRAVVEALAGTGATVLLSARSAEKGARVRDEVRTISGNPDVHVVALDLTALDSVRQAAQSVLGGWPRLDLLVCNAAHEARARTVTAEGFETSFGVNHLGHALLVHELEGRLRASAPSRILIVASEAHRRSKGGLEFDDLMLEREPFPFRLAYSRSKLANILYTRALARHLAGSGVTVNAAHPGGVDTPMMRGNFQRPGPRALYRVIRRLFLTPDEAAAGLLRVALDPALADTSGAYFELGASKAPADFAADDAAADRLWEVTHDLLGLAVS